MFFGSTRSPCHLVFLHLTGRIIRPLPRLFKAQPHDFSMNGTSAFVNFQGATMISLSHSVFFRPISSVIQGCGESKGRLLCLLLRFQICRSVIRRPFGSFLVNLQMEAFKVSKNRALGFVLYIRKSCHTISPVRAGKLLRPRRCVQYFSCQAACTRAQAVSRKPCQGYRSTVSTAPHNFRGALFRFPLSWWPVLSSDSYPTPSGASTRSMQPGAKGAGDHKGSATYGVSSDAHVNQRPHSSQPTLSN